MVVRGRCGPMCVSRVVVWCLEGCVGGEASIARDGRRRVAEPSSTESLQTSHQKYLALRETQRLGAAHGQLQ